MTWPPRPQTAGVKEQVAFKLMLPFIRIVECQSHFNDSKITSQMIYEILQSPSQAE